MTRRTNKLTEEQIEHVRSGGSDYRTEVCDLALRALKGQIPGTEMKGETMSAPTPRTVERKL